VHQVLYMIDSKSGGKKVYSNVCGSMDCIEYYKGFYKRWRVKN
jgi:hypothetical protein